MTSNNPYADAAPYRLWRKGVAEQPSAAINPVVQSPFRLVRTDKVVAAGSCFAQHISRRLRENKFSFLVTETAHPILDPAIAERFHYGVFSARYGNIYTARQLLQLFQRAYGTFTPADDCWEQGGRFFDPFRPQIQPNGFATRAEYDSDRVQHFAAVRRAFEEMDVFVFTLGLTECWVSSEDGAAYPVCPGTAAGVFDASRHAFVNFSVDDVVADFSAFLEALRSVNPTIRVVLTVSPVPLQATALDRHVLVSTAYSKAVLRVAAEMLARTPNVAYFPSYEIVTSAFSRGAYFAPDLRNVTEEGVDHVMRVFFAGMTDEASEPPPQPPEPEPDPVREAVRVFKALCDEDRLDPGS